MSKLTDHARSAIEGALLGLGFAAVALLVGVIRALVVILGGARVSGGLSSEDRRLLVFYVGGFTAAGFLIGAVWPLLPGKLGRYVAFAFGGIVMVFAIVAGDKGGLAALDRTEAVVKTSLGIIFGLAAAYGYLRQPRL